MAMTMKGEVELPANRETVWAKLNDPEVLKVCIPGCQSLEKMSDNEMQAVAKVKVGPVSATFKGKVTLSDIDPPYGYKISGEGQGGIAGFAKGGARVAHQHLLRLTGLANPPGNPASIHGRAADRRYRTCSATRPSHLL